jgi:hypothetical protein
MTPVNNDRRYQWHWWAIIAGDNDNVINLSPVSSIPVNKKSAKGVDSGKQFIAGVAYTADKLFISVVYTGW